jgi:hypothetical protein
LEFVAEQRFVIPAHVRALFSVSADTAYDRLARLTDAGYLARRESAVHQQPGCYIATKKGLDAIASGYKARDPDAATFRHDLGVTWLALAARHGTFGTMRDVVSERRMRSGDARPDRTGEPDGVRLGGYGAGGRERLHYPDVLLVTDKGKRIAVELELSGKGRARRERILGGYAADARIDAVLYLVEHDNVGLARSIATSARQLGIDSIVHVQPVRWGSQSARSGADRAAERTRRRPARPRATAAAQTPRTITRGEGLEL